VNDLPGYVWAGVLLGVIGLPAATVVILVRGARAVRLAGRSAATIAIVAGAVWAGWLAGSVVLTNAGVYRQAGDSANPWIAVTLLAVLAAVLLAARIPTVARILADPGTPARLALPQTFRVVGGVFLIVLGLGELPAVFAVPAGVGDIAVGVAAPFIAWRLSRGDRTGAAWFNVLGIVDLVVAVSTAFLAGSGSTNLLHVTPSSAAVTMLPLALIPTTAVPLAAALHVISLRRLRRSAGSGAAPAAGPPAARRTSPQADAPR
jgi:hypothetical protein